MMAEISDVKRKKTCASSANFFVLIRFSNRTTLMKLSLWACYVGEQERTLRCKREIERKSEERRDNVEDSRQRTCS